MLGGISHVKFSDCLTRIVRDITVKNTRSMCHLVNTHELAKSAIVKLLPRSLMFSDAIELSRLMTEDQARPILLEGCTRATAPILFR